MKLFYLALSLIFFFIPFSILGETMSDLIWNNGLYYKKGSKNPFDGIVKGEINGSFNNGKKHGKWTRYYNNGRVFSISNYYLGLKNGSFITFSKNGQYIEKGKYKKNLEDKSAWNRFMIRYTLILSINPLPIWMCLKYSAVGLKPTPNLLAWAMYTTHSLRPPLVSMLKYFLT